MLYEDTGSKFTGVDRLRTPMHIAVGKLGGIAGPPYVLMGNKIYKIDGGNVQIVYDLSSKINGTYFDNGKSNSTTVLSGNMQGGDTVDGFVVAAYNHNSNPASTRRRLYYIRSNDRTKQVPQPRI